MTAAPATTATPIPGDPAPLIFDHAAHDYYHAGRKLKGVSSLIKQFSRPFDAAYWSARKARKLNVPQQQILDSWEAKRDAACDLGHAVHSFAEQVAIAASDPRQIDLVMSDQDPLIGYKAGVWRAYEELKIRPLETEKPVCEPLLGLAGTVDLIATIPDCDDSIVDVIIDWKTNSTIDLSNSYGDKMLPPLSHLDDCSYNNYCLQLNTYRLLLARRYQFVADRMMLIWLPGDGSYQPIEVPRMDADVAMMLSAWQRNRQLNGE